MSRRTRTVFALVTALAVLLLGGWTAWHTRTATVYVVARDVPRYTRLTEDMIEPKEVSLAAVRELGAVTDRTQVVGRYAALPLRAGAMLTPGMVVSRPPCPVFYPATGRCLPPGREAVEVPLASTVADVLRPDHLVNVWVYLPERRAVQVLLQKHPVLDIVEAAGGRRVVLALTTDEAAVLAPYLVDREQAGRLYATVTAPDGPTYEPLQVIPIPADGAAPRLDERSFEPPVMSTYLDPNRGTVKGGAP